MHRTIGVTVLALLIATASLAQKAIEPGAEPAIPLAPSKIALADAMEQAKTDPAAAIQALDVVGQQYSKATNEEDRIAGLEAYVQTAKIQAGSLSNYQAAVATMTDKVLPNCKTDQETARALRIRGNNVHAPQENWRSAFDDLKAANDIAPAPELTLLKLRYASKGDLPETAASVQAVAALRPQNEAQQRKKTQELYRAAAKGSEPIIRAFYEQPISAWAKEHELIAKLVAPAAAYPDWPEPFRQRNPWIARHKVAFEAMGESSYNPADWIKPTSGRGYTNEKVRELKAAIAEETGPEWSEATSNLWIQTVRAIGQQQAADAVRDAIATELMPQYTSGYRPKSRGLIGRTHRELYADIKAIEATQVEWTPDITNRWVRYHELAGKYLARKPLDLRRVKQ